MLAITQSIVSTYNQFLTMYNNKANRTVEVLNLLKKLETKTLTNLKQLVNNELQHF